MRVIDDVVAVNGEGRDYALSYAIWKLGIKPKSAHNALNDASNTADVIKKVVAADWIRDEREYRRAQAEQPSSHIESQE